jgi:O-antigen/teichoic acid export membrane protein
LNALYALVNMSTWVGVERFLIHVVDGHRRRWLGVAHTLSLAKGGLGAAILLLLAWPTTWLLSIPDALGSFVSLALVPLLAAPTHMRMQQLQRQHVFWPGALAACIGNACGLLVSAAAAFLLRDHRALVWGLCTTSALNAATTHMFTRVAYRISFAIDDLRQALRFGAPLMLNGLALAVLGQLDRIVVGTLVGVTSLGRYGLAMTIVLTPVSLLTGAAILISQPHLSAAWHSAPRTAFPELFRRIARLFAIAAAVFGLGVIMLGDVLLPRVFGPAYAVGDMFMAIVGVMAFVRFAKVLANLGGLAAGRTMDLMLSNAGGTAGLLITALVLWWRPTLNMATVGYLSGDLLATFFIIFRLDQCLRRASGPSPFWSFPAAMPLFAGAILWVVLTEPPWTLRCALVAVALAAGGAVGWQLVVPLRHASQLPKQV